MYKNYQNIKQKSLKILSTVILIAILFCSFFCLISPFNSTRHDNNHIDSPIENNLTITANNSNNLPYYYVTHDAELTIEHDTNSGNIIIPATYYVRTMGEADFTVDGITYRKVSYNNVIGVIEISKLSSKTMADVQVPYFTPKENLVSQNKNTEEHIELWLYHNVPNQILDAEILSKDIELKYIARSSENSDYIYIRTIENTPRYGYVLAKNYLPTVIQKPNPNPINPDTAIDLPDTALDADNKSNSNTANNTAKIILIVILCLLAVLIVFLIFKPIKKKKPSRDDFYEI